MSIKETITNCVGQRIEIFPVDKVIHPFNNGGQIAFTEMAHHTSFRFGNLVLCKLNNLLRSLSVVDFSMACLFNFTD